MRGPALGEHARQGDEGAAGHGPGHGLAHLDVGVGGVLRRVFAGGGTPPGVEGLLGDRAAPSAETSEKTVQILLPPESAMPHAIAGVPEPEITRMAKPGSRGRDC